MKPIAHIQTDLPQKFGIPRNSFLAPHLQGRIVFEPEFALPAAVAGLEEFSHLWLLWEFENGAPGGTAADVAADARPDAAGRGGDGAPRRGVASPAASAGHGEGARTWSPTVRPPRLGGVERRGVASPAASAGHGEGARTWSPTVRPPRLGGVERRGVFATRSPFRPNPIGLTCVKLDRIEFGEAGPVIHVLAADLRDGTPIYDIKPYIPFADCHPEATGGWIEDAPWRELEVAFPAALQSRVSAEKLPGLVEVLRQDPRRAGSKHEPARVYHLAYAGLDVSFTVDGDMLQVIDVEPASGPQKGVSERGQALF